MASPTKEENLNLGFAYAMQLATGIALPMTMQAAIELGIFEIMSKAGPGAKLSSSEIAAKMPTKNPDAPIMLERILRLLASHQVLGCNLDDSERFYSLTTVSKYFAPNQDGVSLCALMSLNLDNVVLQTWSRLKDAVLEGGIPFERTHEMQGFEYLSLDPRCNQLFNVAMFNHSTIVINNILESYEGFKHLKQLVDVGGGLGYSLKAITSRYPEIRGINFDLPHVIEHASSYPGVEHVGGDMFKNVPKGDSIFLKWILHNWSDDDCLKLLKNCYEAIPENGKVIVVEAVVPIAMESSASVKADFQLDLVMMTCTGGGRERTKDEFMALATAAGFRGISYECFVSNFWVMEFFK